MAITVSHEVKENLLARRIGDIPMKRKRFTTSAISACVMVFIIFSASERLGAQVPVRIIVKIEVDLATSDLADAGTNNNAYLGIGGREFVLNLRGRTNELARGSRDIYNFGFDNNVIEPSQNDPGPGDVTTTRNVFPIPWVWQDSFPFTSD